MALLFVKKLDKRLVLFLNQLYLAEDLLDRVHAASNYNSNCNLRNSQNFEIPFARLCSFQSSFFPSTLRLWNNTEESIRSAPNQC